MDRWAKLYELALGEEGKGDARIEITDEVGVVVLNFPDGSKGVYRWSDDLGRWKIGGIVLPAPGDVAARDSF